MAPAHPALHSGPGWGGQEAHTEANRGSGDIWPSLADWGSVGTGPGSLGRVKDLEVGTKVWIFACGSSSAIWGMVGSSSAVPTDIQAAMEELRSDSREQPRTLVQETCPGQGLGSGWTVGVTSLPCGGSPASATLSQCPPHSVPARHWARSPGACGPEEQWSSSIGRP